MAYCVAGTVELVCEHRQTLVLVEIRDTSQFLLLLSALECERIKGFCVGNAVFSLKQLKLSEALTLPLSPNHWELIKCTCVDALLGTYDRPHVEIELADTDLTIHFTDEKDVYL